LENGRIENSIIYLGSIIYLLHLLHYIISSIFDRFAAFTVDLEIFSVKCVCQCVCVRKCTCMNLYNSSCCSHSRILLGAEWPPVEEEDESVLSTVSDYSHCII